MLQLACTPCSLYIYIERERGGRGGEEERGREGERERGRGGDRERGREGERGRERERERESAAAAAYFCAQTTTAKIFLPYRHLLDHMLYTVPLLCTCICMYVWL